MAKKNVPEINARVFRTMGRTMTKTSTAIIFTIFGAGLLASYFVFKDAWAAIDRAVFFFFNTRLVPDSPVLTVTAYANKRVFDVVPFCAMGALYFYLFRQLGNQGRRTMICLGICMLLAGIIIKQCGRFVPVSHPSPTLFFKDINRLTQLTDIVTKDAARNSFPGDHGMMLMVFAAFMARYFGRKAFIAAVVFVVVFSAPRIMSGAHWFSDIYMGSLAIACITLSWFLLTPASDKSAAFLERFLPSWFFPVGETGMFRNKDNGLLQGNVGRATGRHLDGPPDPG